MREVARRSRDNLFPLSRAERLGKRPEAAFSVPFEFSHVREFHSGRGAYDENTKLKIDFNSISLVRLDAADAMIFFSFESFTKREKGKAMKTRHSCNNAVASPLLRAAQNPRRFQHPTSLATICFHRTRGRDEVTNLFSAFRPRESEKRFTNRCWHHPLTPRYPSDNPRGRFQTKNWCKTSR